MLSLINPPNDDRARVYCALATANLTLDVFYKSFSKCVKSTDPIPKGRHIKLLGTDEEELKYLWTALMILGPTGRAGFKSSTIEVNMFAPFNPKTELNFFGRFKSKSLYRRVFLPILGSLKMKYFADEVNHPFGYLVPDDDIQLRDQVALNLCESLLYTYFSFDENTKTVILDARRYRKSLHDIGPVKLSQTFFMLSGELIDALDLSKMNIASLGVEGCVQIIVFSRKMRRLSLDSNNLANLGVEGLSRVLNYIPASISHLSIRNNRLSEFNEQELRDIIDSIPLTTMHIALEYNGLSDELISRLIKDRGNRRALNSKLLEKLNIIGLYTPDSDP